MEAIGGSGPGRAASLSGGIALLLATLSLALPDYPLYVASLTLIYALAAVGLNLTLGYAGQTSLAHGAFMGIGAYTLALLAAHGIPFLAALGGAGVLAFACGILLGYPALKVRHHYLAMVTMGFNIIVFLVMRNEEWLTGGSFGLSGIRRPQWGPVDFADDRAYYLLVLALTAILAAAGAWMVRSPWGRGLRAIRENEIRAEVLGVNLPTYKLAAFAAGALYAGIAGGLFAGLLRYIDPNAFGLDRSIQILLMVVVGGLGRFAGPFVGAVVVTILPEVLRMTQGLYLMLFSLLVILLVLFRPQGLTALADHLWPRPMGRPEAPLTPPGTTSAPGTQRAP
jgi:branched-chain amino acid transport system permease protein